MAKQLEVYAGNYDGRDRVMVAAASKRQAHALMCAALGSMSYASWDSNTEPTGNDAELDLALKFPGVVFSGRDSSPAVRYWPILSQPEHPDAVEVEAVEHAIAGATPADYAQVLNLLRSVTAHLGSIRKDYLELLDANHRLNARVNLAEGKQEKAAQALPKYVLTDRETSFTFEVGGVTVVDTHAEPDLTGSDIALRLANAIGLQGWVMDRAPVDPADDGPQPT